MRRQLDIVRHYNKLAKVKASPASRKPKQQTQYRNYKPAEGTEEFVEAKQQRKTSKTALSALSLYGEDGQRIAPVLIVDGYNVVGAWPKLKKFFVAGELDQAREKLMSDLGEYLHYKGVRVICVWDARGGSSLSTMHDTMAFGVEVVYEAVHTADAFIEAKSQQLLRVTRDAPLVLVATDDMACREVVNGQGALTISTSLLIQEIKKVKRDSMEQLKDPLLNRVAGRRVQDNLSPEARDKLLAVLREDNARRRRGLGLG